MVYAILSGIFSWPPVAGGQWASTEAGTWPRARVPGPSSAPLALPARPCTLALTGLWGMAMLAVIWQLPTPAAWLIWASWLYVIYYVGLSLYLLRLRRR